MREIDDEAQATKDCSRCGGRAFYWRTAIVAANTHASVPRAQSAPHHHPVWTCMHCGHIEPYARPASAPRAS